MSKTLIFISVIVGISLILFFFQIALEEQIDIWPVNKISSKAVTSNENSNNTDVKKITGGSSGSSGSRDASSSNQAAELKKPYDVDGDNFLSCELTATDDYTLSGNYIVINQTNRFISFIFEKVEVFENLHPDNLPEVNLKYNLYPENPDDVLYSDIFLADDNKLYICY